MIRSAVRKPQNNSLIKSVASTEMRCKVDPFFATSTVTVAIGFELDASIYRRDPAAIYLGKAPNSVPTGLKLLSGAQPSARLASKSPGAPQPTTTILENVPAGEVCYFSFLKLYVFPLRYLVRVELGLVVSGSLGCFD